MFAKSNFSCVSLARYIWDCGLNNAKQEAEYGLLEKLFFDLLAVSKEDCHEVPAINVFHGQNRQRSNNQKLKSNAFGL